MYTSVEVAVIMLVVFVTLYCAVKIILKVFN